LFIGYKPTILIPVLVREIKNNSSKFINQEHLCPVNFNCQEGYGVFSYSHSHLDSVFNYIKNQENHHQKQTFKEEYGHFLTKFDAS